MTPEQKAEILAATDSNLSTAKAAEQLNNTTVAGTVVKEGKELIPIPEVTSMLEDAELLALYDFMETEAGRAFKIRWNQLDNLDVCHPRTRASVTARSAIIGADKAAGLLSLGERQKVKADEILGRLATAADIEEARS